MYTDVLNQLYRVHGRFKSFISLHSVGDFKALIAAYAKELDVHPVETKPCD
jgi:hypothetical protein